MPRIGIKGQTYINMGTHDSPEWARAKILHDLTVEASKTEVAIKNKGSRCVKYLAGLKEMPLDVDVDWEPGDPVFDALDEAFLTDEPLELLTLDGSIGKEGSKGLRAGYIVTKLTRNEPLDDEMTGAMSLRLAADWPHEPAEVMVGAGGALTVIHEYDEEEN